MLQEIRERAQGWVAWAIVILISIPFALWGIQSYLGSGSDPTVASVNGIKITERELTRNVQYTRMQLRERLGSAYNAELFGGAALRERVLNQMIEQRLVLDTAHRIGLRVSDEVIRAAILAEPMFQRNGVFDRASYERVLQLQGLTPNAYEHNLREHLLSNQLERAVQATALITDHELQQSIRWQHQQRELRYVQLQRDDYLPTEPPSESAVRAFYDAHQTAFQTPEQVRLAYIHLSAAELARDTVDEETLRARYAQQQDQFTTPEQRTIRHILLKVPTDADDAQRETIRQELAELRERILEGEDFAEFAAEYSEDTVSAADGGAIGSLERGQLDPAFDQVAFELAVGELSEPVRTRFGYHLIEVTAISGGELSPFEDVRDQLAMDSDASGAEGMFFELAEQLANLAYETPDSLIPAAETLGLEVQVSDWLDRSGQGAEAELAHPRIFAAAFSPDVLERGQNSELLEPESQQLEALVLRVEDHRPSAVKPFDEVREEIVEQLQEQAAAKAALAAAEAMVAQLQQGATWAEIDETLTVQEPGLVERSAHELPPVMLTHAFQLPHPHNGVPRYGAVAAPNGDAFVVAVAAVVDGVVDALDADDQQLERQMLTATMARHETEQLLAAFMAAATIERKLVATSSDDE